MGGSPGAPGGALSIKKKSSIIHRSSRHRIAMRVKSAGINSAPLPRKSVPDKEQTDFYKIYYLEPPPSKYNFNHQFYDHKIRWHFGMIKDKEYLELRIPKYTWRGVWRGGVKFAGQWKVFLEILNVTEKNFEFESDVYSVCIYYGFHWRPLCL